MNGGSLSRLCKSLLEGRAEKPVLSVEEAARLGGLWDEGLESGPGEAPGMEEIVEYAKSGTPG